MSSIEAEVARQLPVVVDEVEYLDPTFTAAGPRWALAVTCPWTLQRGEKLITWDVPDLESEVRSLIGLRVMSITFKSDLIDPVVTFSNGDILKINADSDLDPWVLRLSGIVLVGRLTPL